MSARWATYIITLLVLAMILTGCGSPTPAATAYPPQAKPAGSLPAYPPNLSTPSIAAAGKYSGKLSSRLAQLANSPELTAANPADQAKALSLPAQGPGSLMRDGQGRLLVEIRVTDVSDATLKDLADHGAMINHVAQDYLTVSAFVATQDLQNMAALATVQSVTESLAPANGGGSMNGPK
jgi:hypothetical protein